MNVNLSIATEIGRPVPRVIAFKKTRTGLGATMKADREATAAQPSILERIGAGDSKAVNECINTYGDLVWSLARRFMGNSADLDDAVQEVFISIWSNANRYKPDIAKEVTFISMIARRRLIDRLRKSSRAPNTEEYNEDIDYHSAANGNVGYQSIELQNVLDILETMPAEQSKILMLSAIEGYSHSEISEKLAIPLGTVKTWIRRGMVQVRDKMDLAA